eukprot:CAMPEP_0176174308 /NCGR_PEP_ID=MMETSP0120_2-20121206/89305_1 /TAXON_ID=160619 /ORGANISM="Kryptoperidinium foliaceum, Strain CCMP 1326" /LENGTH=147 /DNA_ID=CAMNT_0017512343 /DNA_START=35 /DNA_END=479 /DNA_ORIENTATION=+
MSPNSVDKSTTSADGTPEKPSLDKYTTSTPLASPHTSCMTGIRDSWKCDTVFTATRSAASGRRRAARATPMWRNRLAAPPEGITPVRKLDADLFHPLCELPHGLNLLIPARGLFPQISRKATHQRPAHGEARLSHRVGGVRRIVVYD